jgi:hypothetical protein
VDDGVLGGGGKLRVRLLGAEYRSLHSGVGRDQRARIELSEAAVIMRTKRNTYTGYSIGCAGVWGVILLLGRRRLDSQTWNTLRLMCGGWWIGWTSATIARLGYPPPKPLTPAGEKRLRIISSVLVALGLANTVRMFAAGHRPTGSTPGA